MPLHCCIANFHEYQGSKGVTLTIVHCNTFDLMHAPNSLFPEKVINVELCCPCKIVLNQQFEDVTRRRAFLARICRLDSSYTCMLSLFHSPWKVSFASSQFTICVKDLIKPVSRRRGYLCVIWGLTGFNTVWKGWSINILLSQGRRQRKGNVSSCTCHTTCTVANILAIRKLGKLQYIWSMTSWTIELRTLIKSLIICFLLGRDHPSKVSTLPGHCKSTSGIFQTFVSASV